MARQETVRQEAVRQEATRQEATRQEAARQEAARQEAARQDAARQDAARQEAARREAAKSEAARREVSQQEVNRREAARQADEGEATRGKSQANAAATRDANGDGNGRSAAVKPAPGSAEKAPNAAPQPIAMSGALAAPSAAPRLPDLRPVMPVAPPPPPPPNVRRRTLVARTDRNVVLTMYAEGWRQRVELNAAVETLNLAKSKSHVDPVVTVALRSDGSVEGVVFDRTSGVPEIDDAIRRIVLALAPYGTFPPDLANDYDVIEIRRVWTFETALRLFAGGR